ncbi:MAG TPA: DUF6259 domain-containing protein, partial [Acidobacteriota bacterium]|nr:DUF6259 domain-containing protein [Acidobacteriota bacterium]
MRRSYAKIDVAMGLLGFVLVILLVSDGFAQPEFTKRGWWPQDYSVRKDAQSGKMVLSTPYYSIEHDLKQGGAITKIVLTHGKVDNLLLKPMETNIRLLTERLESQSPFRQPETKDIYRDTLDSSPSVSHTSSDKSEVVTVLSELMNDEGLKSGVSTKTTYTYRWGYIRIRKEFSIREAPIKARSLSVLSTILHPTLTDYGYRPAASEEMGPNPHSWQNGQIRRWGKIRPGTHFDLPFRTRYVPRYLVMANHGVEGMEWFCTDELSQWDYQMSGQPGTGYCELSPVTDPLGVAFSIFPLNLSPQFKLQQGGWVSLEGSYVFDYYIGLPILEGHAHNPWLNQGYRASGGKWVSEEEIRSNKENGVVTMHLHNDGDHAGDGLFWRDGSYPPYPPEEMEKMEKTIDSIHKYGIKTVPYFSNHEFHQSNDGFWRMAEQWGRKPDDQANIRPNYYYGAHMCLKSGWLDYFKFTVDRVLKNHDFDGVYYDWNIAMFCNNSLHVNETTNGVPPDNGLGALALSPTG